MIILSIITIFISKLLIIANIEFTVKKNDQAPLITDQCQNEWEQLSDKMFFRKNLAFYYSDTNLINLYLGNTSS